MNFQHHSELIAILLVGLTAVAGLSAAILSQDSHDPTGAASLKQILKKIKHHTPRPNLPPPPPAPAPLPSAPVSIQPTPAPHIPSIPTLIVAAAPQPALPPSCNQVTGGQGTCMSRYCDTGPNSLDKVESSGYCPGANEVCCIKNYLSGLPDTTLTCDQVRARYGYSASWCIQQLPCKGILPQYAGRSLPRYIGKTADCAMCCVETAR